MSRCRAGLALLVVLLAASTLMNRWVCRHLEPVSRQLELAQQAASREDWPEALACGAAARESWEGSRRIFSALLDHDPLEQLDGLFLTLEPALQAREPLAAATTCAQARSLTEMLTEEQKLFWWNLL